MQLKVEQLSAEITRNALAGVYLISGDEPMQLNEAADLIRRRAREQGAEERVVLDVAAGFEWHRLLEESTNMSLFSHKRLIELRLNSGKPGREGGKVLSRYIEKYTEDNVLLITSDKLDKQVQKSQWYRSLDKAGVVVQVWPVENAKLPIWIRQRVKARNKSIARDAAQLIADSIEGNMLAAAQEIDKLCLLTEGHEITVNDVMSAITECTRFDVFALIECAYTTDVKHLLRMLRSLRNEGLDVMAVYGALMWDYRRLCTLAHHFSCGIALNKLFIENRIWGEGRKRAIAAMVRRYPPAKLHALLQQANALEKMIKSADRDVAWDNILTLLLAFSGHRVISESNFNHG